MQYWDALRRRFADAFPVARYGALRLAIAVSGGADSVALLRLLVADWQAASVDLENLRVLHFNHRVRGDGSDADCRFVAELAASLGVPFISEAARDATGSDEHSSEESLRRLRYDFFHRTAAREGCRCVLTAHTADDRIETVLHHLLRGTGPEGLCGIPARRDLGLDFQLVRPLLAFRAGELRQALNEISQPWREDITNADDRYRRNWIRTQLLPLVRSRYPSADESILRLIDSQAQWRDTIRRQARSWLDRSARFEPESVRLARGPVDPSVFAAAVRIIWDERGWPRQALDAGHHASLHALVSGTDHQAITLPGDIPASVSDNETLRIGPPINRRQTETLH